MSENILFNPFPKQIEFIEAAFGDKYTQVLYGGAIRGGKTFAGLGTLVMFCKFYPKTRWAVVRDSLQTLKRTTIPSFFKVCPEKFIDKYNQETQTVTFTNGSQIIFFGENFAEDKELNRWKGLEVNGFLLEEVNELQEASFIKAIERSGSHIIPNGKTPKPVILMTCNPAQNWVKERFYDKWKKGELPEDVLYIPSKITENPYLPEEYIKSLNNMPTYEYEIFVNGNWDLQMKTGGEFYQCFEIDKHIANTFYDPSLPLHISWDENVRPYLPVGIFQIKNGREIHMIDELAMADPMNNIKDACAEFRRRYRSHSSGLYIYGDATSRKADTKVEKGYNFFKLIEEELKSYRPQMMLNKANPSVQMRGNFLNLIFEKEYDGIKIVIGKNCKEMTNDLIMVKKAADQTKNKEMATDPKTKVRYQKYGHFSDLLDYLVCTLFVSEFARYQHGSPSGGRFRMGRAGHAKHGY